MNNKELIYKALFVPSKNTWADEKGFTAKNLETFLRVMYPSEEFVFEDIRKELAYYVLEGMLTAENTTTGRIYSFLKSKTMEAKIKTKKPKVEPQVMKVSATNLIKAIVDNKGKMTSVLFTKIDGTQRTVNGIFHNQTTLGNVMFKEASYYRALKAGKLTGEDHEFTQMLPKNILEVRTGGVRYVLNKTTKKC